VRISLFLILLFGVMMGKNLEKVVLGGGCFWCIEAVYEEMKGVKSAISGYAGGNGENPTYEDVCNGVGGYAEAVEILFDRDEIGLKEVLDVFWKIHDPTSLNAQGADVGIQYRSVIFYSDEVQKKEILDSLQNAQKSFAKNIVTQVEKLENFYKAEEYHQDYFAKNPNQGYCRVVVAPKVEKFKNEFGVLKK